MVPTKLQAYFVVLILTVSLRDNRARTGFLPPKYRYNQGLSRERWYDTMVEFPVSERTQK